ncbi:MAG: Ig-like domain-containing protein [Vicinamibacterales bacterium]
MPHLALHRRPRAHAAARPGRALLRLCAALLLVFAAVPTPGIDAQTGFLGKAEISLYGIGLTVQPQTQTVPKGYATIVSTFLQAAAPPQNLPPFPAGTQVLGTLRGPSFQQPINLVAAPNTPFAIPVLTVAGTHVVDNIRLVDPSGNVLLYGTPEAVTIEVIDKLLVTAITSRALTADEIQQKGIVYDKSNFQAYNFTAAFATDDGSTVDVTFPVVLPTLGTFDAVDPLTSIAGIDAPQLHSLQTLIPDTLQIQARIPNLKVVGFTMTLDDQTASQDFFAPKIPGVIVIPGDIGFLNQFFSVMLMVGNVAPTGSNLVVSNLTASLVLPPGQDNVVGSTDDPLAMAKRANGVYPMVVGVTQAGPDGILGNGDDITDLGPGQTGNAEFLVEGRREGTHVVEMDLSGTLNGMPVGPVAVHGRVAGAVLVRNPKFQLTFTHPDTVNAGEAYTLDVTVTNTSTSPANFVSVNLFPANISGAQLTGSPSQSITSIEPGDSATVTFDLVSQRTGAVTAATLDSDENVAGRFVLKSAIGELGVPLSPDSLVLPKEANGLPATLKAASLGLLGRAWSVATAPPAAMPVGLSRFSRQMVLDRAVEVAEAGMRISLGETVERSSTALLFDFLGSEYANLSSRVPANDTSGMLGRLQADVAGFDTVRRLSQRGDVFASAVGDQFATSIAAGGLPFHQALAGQLTASAPHVSVLITSPGGLPVDAVLVDDAGQRTGDVVGVKTQKQIPFSDSFVVNDANGQPIGQMLVVAVPQSTTYRVELTRRAGSLPATTYDVSIAYPAPGGGLNFASWAAVQSTEVPVLTQGSGDTPQILFRTMDNPAPNGRLVTPTSVANPPPTVLGAFQVAGADVAGCPLDDRVYEVGRVVAVLFSEEVTAASVQDRLPEAQITAFTSPGNRVVSVALQPGGRVAYLALREPVGPFVPSSIVVNGVTDQNGNALAGPVTLPIVTTVGTEAGVVSGQVKNADGTAAPGAIVRMFYEFDCGLDQNIVGVAEEVADATGAYRFDYVLNAPAMTVRLQVIDPATNDLRNVRFRLARSGQQLNVDVVMLGRGILTGRTLAEDGSVLANTALRITSLTDQSQYAATSDALGVFVVGRVPVGNVLIEAVNVTRPAQLFVSDLIPFAGATVTRDLVLLDPVPAGPAVPKAGTLTGLVVKSDGVTPVVDVPVIAYYTSRSQAGVKCSPPPGGTQEPSECAIQVVRTDATGRFSFASLTAGQLRINTFDQVELLEGDVRVTLADQEVRDITVLLAGGFATVTGVVLDSSGVPVADAVVGGGFSLVNANPDGTFTLTDVPVGRRRIVAASNALQATGESIVDLVQQGEVVHTTIRMPAVGAVAGIVRDHGGVPQAGIKVYVLQDCFDEFEQPSVCILGQAVTDLAGAYRIGSLGIGQYRVSAFRADLRDGNIRDIAIRYDHQTLVTDITFRGGTGTVNGRVLRAAGTCSTPPCVDTPLPAKVSISGDQLVTAGGTIGVRFEYVQNFEVVDNDFTTGDYAFSQGVWTGPFTVRAAGQFSPDPVAAEGTMPGPNQTVTIDLRLQPTSRITGTIFESDGFTPVTNRQVALTFKSDAVVVFCHDDASTGESVCTTVPQGIQQAFAATDANGVFSFPIVNAGPFTITATDAQTGKVASVKGSVRAGETVDVPMRLLGRAPVTVRVFRSNGTTPVLGAQVSIQGIEYPMETRAGVAVDGTIAFAGADALSEGQFIVTATDANGFAGRKAGRVVLDGTAVTVDVFLFDATGTVAGQVVKADSSGALVSTPNAEVILSTASGPIAYTLTDATGYFSVSLVPTGNVTVEAFDPVTAGRGRSQAVVLGGAQSAFQTITLEALGSIRGTVVQRGSLAPLKGWTVQLAQSTTSGRSLPTQVTQTGVDGSFSFPGASVGSFSLFASQRSVVGNASVSGTLARGGQLLDVPMVVDIVRRVTGSVAGQVLGPQGTPVPNAQVDVCATGDPCRSTLADGSGRFLMSDVALGRFTVRGSAQVTGAPSVGTTGGTLLFEGDTADVTITLLGLSSIDGTVFETVNGVQVPAANATVRLTGQPGSGCPGACVQGTDASGRFHFINVPAQTFTVSATSFNGQQGSIGDVLVPGQAKTGLQVVLAPSVRLSGRVLLANTLPAPGVVIDLTANGGHLFTETATDGTFSFDAISSSTYRLFAQDPIGPGLARRSGPVTLAQPMDLGDIILDAAPPAVASSDPVAGALGVARNKDILITFTEPVDATTVTSSTITLLGPNGPVAGLVDTQAGDTVARFRLLPGVQLADQARYTVRVSGVADRVGRPMTADAVIGFTTVDVTAPSIYSLSPVQSATGASINSVVRVQFSEMIDPTKFAGSPIVVTGPAGVVAGTVAFLQSNTVAVFTPNVPLQSSTQYSVRVLKATDLVGLTGAADTTYVFDTTDGTPPVILSLGVDGGATAIEGTVARARATVAATDVSVVDFFLNGVFSFAARSTPFVMDFAVLPSLVDANGHITITALATDTSGNRAIVPAQTVLTVVPDQAPAVAVVQPSTLTPAPGERVTLAVQATDDVGVSEISYAVRTAIVVDASTRAVAPAATSRTEVFAFNVPAGAVPGSTLTVDASAKDTAAHSTQATPLVLRVRDTIGPNVQITGVSSGQRVAPGATVSAVVVADDVSGIASLGFATSGITATTQTRPVSPAQLSVATAFSFTVPANATSTDRVFIDAYAIDAAGNRTDAARLIVPVADRQAPTLTLRTASGANTMTPGGTVDVIADAQDDLAIASVSLSATGAFTFADTKTPAVQQATDIETFTLSVPSTLVNGDTVTVTARATDASGNQSAPVSITLTAQTVTTVTLPPSVLLLAGDQLDIPVTLGAPAPAGGAQVDLVSRAPGVATVTSPVTFAAGETTKLATIHAVAGGTTTVDALVSGVVRATTTVTVSGGVVRGDVSVASPTGFQLVPGAQVTIFHAGTPLTTVTDAQGHFLVEGVIGQSFTVTATDGSRLDVEAFSLDVPNGSATVSLILLDMGLIQGTVYQPNLTTPVGAGAKVDLFEAAAPNVVIATTFTDAAGAYQFPLVAPGPYIVEASDLTGNRGRSSAQVSSGQQQNVPVVYLGRGTVTVHVRNGVGASVAGANVQLQSSSLFGGAPARSGNTDAAGTVAFADVFIGSVSATGTDPFTNQGGSASGQVTTDGESVTLNVQFAQYGNLTGTIFRRDGVTPAPGAQVRVDMSGGGRFNTTADVNGVYRLDFLPFASFTLTVFDPATRGRVIDSGVFTASGQTLVRNEVLLPQGALLVTVVDAGGVPVNGATVTATTQAQGLQDSQQGVTAQLNGNDGQVLIDRMLAGTFTVTANAAGLGGSASGVLVADEIHTVTVQLEATATIAGTVFEPDGQTPAAGSVRVINQQNGQISVLGLVNGAFSATDLKLGSYVVEAYDTGGGMRARSGVVTLSANAQTVPVSLTFVGLGSVQGRVLHPSGGDVGNLTVSLRSFNATFGGFQSTQTDAAGNFVFGAVPTGAVTLTTSKASEQLIGESTGAVTSHAQVLTLDILLEANAVGLPTALNDVQDSSYGINTDGGLAGGTGNVFIRGGAKLALTVNGTTLPFTGASFGTREDSGREIVVRQPGLLGLNVTRKISVPTDGYFARFLEVLQNPGAAPITVDVNVTSQPYGQTTAFCCIFGENQYFVGATSSGDGVLDAATPATADQWASLVVSGQDSYYNGNSGTPLGFVFSGPGATAPVNTASFSYVQSVPTLKYGWNSITVPAGGEVVLMHFVSEQASNTAATASSQRLVQLPPEALNGLSAAELAGIANFVVPANGVSTVAPLPSVAGVITGRVLEGDNATPVPGAVVTFRSTDPVLARMRRTTADGTGAFSFTGGIGHPIPVTSFSLSAQHTVNPFTVSPALNVGFTAGSSTTQDVVFSQSGILRGTVLRHTGVPAAGAQVEVASGFAFQTTGANGRYGFGGVFTGNVTLRGQLPHAQGTALKIVAQTLPLAAGQVRDDILYIEPTGTITGSVLDANDLPQVGRPVTLSATNFSRFTTTDSAGGFTFGDVPVGTFTLTSNDPNSGFPTTVQVPLVQDQVANTVLRYAGKGSITVTVTRATGALLPGMSVSVSSPSVNTQTLTTDASGVAGPFNNLPLGQTFTITASHPGNSFALRASTSLILGATQASATLAMPAFGTVSATITRPNGTLPGANVNTFLSSTSGSPSFSASVSTNAASQVSFGVVPVGRPFTIRAFRTPTVQFGATYGLTTAPFTLTTDGEALAVTTHYPAVAQVVVTATSAGQPLANARIEERDSGNGFFQFRANTDAAGQVTIAEVPEGPVDIRVYQPGSTSTVLDIVQGQVTASDDAGSVAVVADVKNYNVTVTGRIFENDGLTGLTTTGVSLRLLRGVDNAVLASTCTCFTNPMDGTFTFPAVTSPSVGLVLEVFSPVGGSSIKVPLATAANGTITQDVTLPVYTATLNGHVYASDGVTPVPGGVVFEYNLSGNQGGWGASVQPDGSYAFSPLVLPIEGVRLEYNLTGLTGGKYSVTTVPFTSSHQVVTTDIVLNQGTVSTITGSVTAGDGVTPLSNSYVELTFPSATGVSGSSTYTDSQGHFQFVVAVPAAGDFTLTAHSPFNYTTSVQFNGTATVQGGIVDAGVLTLPVSVLRGFATTGPSAPVNSLTAYVTDTNGAVTFANQVTGNSFEFLELPAGDYQLTVVDDDSGMSTRVSVTLPTALSVVTGVHVQLPIVGAVQVQVQDENGNPTDAATISLLGSGTFERIIHPYNNSGGGQYDFTGVALGNYVVQGALDVCDQGGTCTTRYASVPVSVVDTSIVPVSISFAATPSVSVVVEDGAGTPQPFTDVDVAVQSLATGTLGTFLSRFQATTDGLGIVQLPYVPEGLFVVSVSNPLTNEAGTATGTASLAQPTQVEVLLSYDSFSVHPFAAWQLNSSQTTDRFTVFDDKATIFESYRWDGTAAYENGAFSRALELKFGGSACCIVSGTYTDTMNELTFSPVVTTDAPGVTATRRMRSLEAGNLVRVLDTFTNTSATARTIQVNLDTLPNRSSSFGPESAPSTTTGGYFVRYDSQSQAPAFGIVYAGVDAPVAPMLVTDDGFSLFSAMTSLTVPAGQSVSLLSYLLVETPSGVAAATVASRASAVAAGTTPTMLEGLSREDLLSIANFRVTVPPPGPGTIRVKVLDGFATQTNAASVALVGNGTTTVLQPFQDVNGLFEFANVVPGTYVVQASYDGCDQVVCGVFYTDATVTVGSDATVTKTLSFAQLGQAVIEVRDETGTLMPFEDVDVEVRSLAGAGPLGAYSTNFTVTLGASSSVLIDHLPPGAFTVHVHAIARGMDGVANGTASRLQPPTTVVQLAFDVLPLSQSAYIIGGVDGFYQIGSTGAVEQVFLWDGTQFINQGALTIAGRPYTGSTPICCPLAAIDTGNGWAYLPVAVPSAPGVTLTRSLRSAPTGQFVRFVDVLTNTGTAPQSVPLSLWTTPNLSQSVVLDVAPSASTPGYFVRSEQAQGALSFGVVYNGVNPPVALTAVVDTDQVTMQTGTTLQLAPGQSVALLHFVVLRAPDNAAGVVTGADALGTLADPEALNGLSPAELGAIVNFTITP